MLIPTFANWFELAFETLRLTRAISYAGACRVLDPLWERSTDDLGGGFCRFSEIIFLQLESQCCILILLHTPFQGCTQSVEIHVC